MNVYHRTTSARLRPILADGFRDGEGTYMTDRVWRGVWVSDRDLEEHAFEVPALLTLDVPDDVLAEYEWVQEDLGYREFLVPARVLNTFGPPKVVSSSEDDGSSELLDE